MLLNRKLEFLFQIYMNIYIDNDNISTFTWPLTVSENSTVYLKGMLTFTDLVYSFVITGSNINIIGVDCVINMNIGYLGLVSNIDPDNININISNIKMNCTVYADLIVGGGWICQHNFNNGTVTNCNVSGNISPNSGGIFGKCANNCKAINCFSTGNINVYGGGIFGSYCTNCIAINCYSIGMIAPYSGGIFGFGTGYFYDGTVTIPSVILNQFGSIINALSIVNTASTAINYAINCYSAGNISVYAGGIFGYASYLSTAINCYNLGNGSDNNTSGGIFAMNVYTGLTMPYCSVQNCYSTGTYIIGVFGSETLYNFNYNSYYDNNIWNISNAKKYLIMNDKIWTENGINPFLLSSFNGKIYNKDHKKIKKYDYHNNHDNHNYITESHNGIYQTGAYSILSKDHKDYKICINCITGKLKLKLKKNKIKKDIIIKVLNGNTNLINNYLIYSNYNINYFTFIK